MNALTTLQLLNICPGGTKENIERFIPHLNISLMIMGQFYLFSREILKYDFYPTFFIRIFSSYCHIVFNRLLPYNGTLLI